MLFIANKFFEIAVDSHWSIWIITIWLFLFILHFIKIFITDRFMNKIGKRANRPTCSITAKENRSITNAG
jgi:hypothetical protein